MDDLCRLEAAVLTNYPAMLLAVASYKRDELKLFDLTGLNGEEWTTVQKAQIWRVQVLLKMDEPVGVKARQAYKALIRRERENNWGKLFPWVSCMALITYLENPGAAPPPKRKKARQATKSSKK